MSGLYDGIERRAGQNRRRLAQRRAGDDRRELANLWQSFSGLRADSDMEHRSSIDRRAENGRRKYDRRVN